MAKDFEDFKEIIYKNEGDDATRKILLSEVPELSVILEAAGINISAAEVLTMVASVSSNISMYQLEKYHEWLNKN